MPEKFTSDELVELAELCGYQVEVNPSGTVWVRRPQNRGWNWWQPDKDANQCDEIVEAAKAGGWRTTVMADPDHGHHARMHHLDGRRVISPWFDTHGDAVCRAAIEAIKKGKK